MRKIVAVLLSVVSLCACTSIDCPVQNLVYTVYNAYDGRGEAFTLQDTMYVYTHRRNGSDTLILNAAIGTSTFSLPISYTCPEDTLYFLFVKEGGIVADTVHIKKEDIPHFESVDCSASFFHHLQSVRTTHHVIDSIIINKSNVDYDVTTEHFHIYFTSSD